MKLPEWVTTEELSLNSPTGDEEKFPKNTIVFPFWNEHYVPEHIKERLESQVRSYFPRKVVYCILGTNWIVLPKELVVQKR